MAKICIARFFNGLHSELSRAGLDLFDRTKGAVRLLSQAKIATTNHYQALDLAIFPWLEDEFKNCNCEIGQGKFSHALMPFLSGDLLEIQNATFNKKGISVDFLPEFAVSRPEEIVGKYFYMLTGKNFCPEHGEISRHFSLLCPGEKIGLVMNEDLWGGLEKAFYAFMVNPKSRASQDALLSALQIAQCHPAPYIIWPMDAEVYAIGSAYGIGAMEEFCEFVVKNRLSDFFAPVSDCLGHAARNAVGIDYYPHRDLAKWFKHREQLEWFQRISRLEQGLADDVLKKVIFLIAANSDYASAVRWRITGPTRLSGCLHPDGNIYDHFIKGSEDVIAIQEAALRVLEKGSFLSQELLEAPDYLLTRRMLECAFNLEKAYFGVEDSD